MNIIGKRNWYFLISLLIIIPGLLSLFVYGLKLSIDFTGGSRISLQSPSTSTTTVNHVRDAFIAQHAEVASIQSSRNSIVVRTAPIDTKQEAAALKIVQKIDPNIKQVEYETIGPTVGREITVNAFKAIVVASLLIILYIAWSFRSIPKPASSWRFGVCAILALIHDVLVLIGLFSIFGHFFNVEVDSLFVTAVLTVIGFSVHDTIVVFDRIRENLLRTSNTPFPQVVNDSILQTLGRSLNTSLTAMLVLFALLLFGGESTRWFIVALLIGIASGTYSSIFNASPLLVVWQEWENKRRGKRVLKK